MLKADFQGAMHGQLQGWFLEVLKGALQEAHSFNRRVPVFQIAKKNEKGIIQQKSLWPLHPSPHPLANLHLPIPTPQDSLSNCF